MHISSLYNVPLSSTSMCSNVYDSASRSSNSLPNLGGSVLGLRSTVGLFEYSFVHTIPGIPDKTIRQGLQGEYVCLDDFLQNNTVNNTGFFQQFLMIIVQKYPRNNKSTGLKLKKEKHSY